MNRRSILYAFWLWILSGCTDGMKTKELILDASLDPVIPPEPQAEFSLSASSYSGDENTVIQFTINRAVRVDQECTINWAITNASVLPVSGTETFPVGLASLNINVTAQEIDTNESGDVTLSGPTLISGPVSNPILGSPITSLFQVFDTDNIIHLNPKLGQSRFGLRNYTLKDQSGIDERAEMAKRDMVFLGMYRDGLWDNPSSPSTMYRPDVVTDLKARKQNLIITDYLNVMETGETGVNGLKCAAEVGPTGNGGGWGPNDWFAHKTNGDTFGSFGSSLHTNPTAFVTLDSQGRDYVDWYYEGSVTDILSPHVGESGIGPDGMNPMLDNVFRAARTNSLDYDRDGNQDNGRSDPLSVEMDAWRAGTAKVLERVLADHPNALLFGNITEWFAESITPVVLPAQYLNLLHGGFVENNSENFPFCGVLRDGSINPTFGSGELAFAAYTYAMDNVMAPKYVVNGWAFDINGDPYSPGAGSNFKNYRWAHTMTCLLNGYFHYEENDNYNNFVNMDEMGTINEGITGLNPNWLGTWTDPEQRTPIHDSLYIRRATGGAVIHNMDRTSSVFVNVGVDIPTGYNRLNGVQDTSVNNGNALTSFTLDGSDGLFVST